MSNVVETAEEKLLKRIINGGEYFYKMKPSEFHRNYSEWPRLMALCKLISQYGEMVLERKVNDILMRPPVEQQSLIESLDKTDNKTTDESSSPQLPGQQELPLLKE